MCSVSEGSAAEGAPGARDRTAEGSLPFAGANVAIVHDWLTGMRGGEWVLDLLCELLPRAVVHTLVHIPGRLSRRIEAMEIRTSFIDRLPGAHRLHQRYLPLFPAAVERFDLSTFDFVLSTSHCVAKGAIPRSKARHVCYCHTPMRYVWKFYDEYFNHRRSGRAVKMFMPPVAALLRRWDRRTAGRVDRYIANSRNVAGRIEEIYGRHSEVIYPPVDLSRFRCDRVRRDYYLMVTALVPYKRVESAVLAFNRLGERLVIVGRGVERSHLESIAGPNIEFRGWVDDSGVARLYEEARALIFPGEEDFGIVPLEAQAAGCPVIALRAGGALETVVDAGEHQGEGTGLFFDRSDPDAICNAVERAARIDFDPAYLRENAKRFDRSVFRERILKLLFEEEALLERRAP